MYRIAVVIILLALTGCAPKVPMLMNEISSLPADAACRMTILPLMDRGSFPRGAAVFYKVLLAELIASGHFQVTEEGDLLELYRQFRIYPNREPSSEQLRMIGGRLGTTLFVGGDILKMNERHKGNFPYVELTVELRFYDGRTGKETWTTYHSRRSEDYQQILHFGRINTMTALAKRMSQEIITLWLEKGMIPCEG